MNDIFERIVAAQEKFKTQSINPPNVIYMNMADYRALCDRYMHRGMIVSRDVTGKITTINPIHPKPAEIFGMRIAKKAGANLECEYDEMQPPKNYMTIDAVKSVRTCEHGLVRAFCPYCMDALFKSIDNHAGLAESFKAYL